MGAVEVCDVSGGGWADTRGYIPFSILLPVDTLAPVQQHGAITFIHQEEYNNCDWNNEPIFDVVIGFVHNLDPDLKILSVRCLLIAISLSFPKIIEGKISG